jgi:uncharacterized membrane protein
MGHSIHPILIVFPLGLLTTAVIFDIIYLASGRAGFATAAGYIIAAGVLGGLAAGVFGFIDWLAIPSGTRAKRVGAAHGLGNVVVLALFAISWALRTSGQQWKPGVAALILSFAGILVAGMSGWLGGELVERLGVGVDEKASLNAPSSLRHIAR